MNNTESFADKVRRLRKAAGLTQAQFAERLFISRDYLSQLENGREPGDRLVQQVELLEKVGIPNGGDADLVSNQDMVLEEAQAPYGTPAMLRQDIERHHRALLTQAGDDVARLGWILIQQQTHLRSPADWQTTPAETPKNKPLVVKAPAHQQNPRQPGEEGGTAASA